MDDGLHAGHSLGEPGTRREVAFDCVDVTAGVAAQDARAVSSAAQLRHHVASQRAGAASHQDVHLSPIIVSERRRACRPRRLEASAGYAGPLRSGPLSPSR